MYHTTPRVPPGERFLNVPPHVFGSRGEPLEGDLLEAGFNGGLRFNGGYGIVRIIHLPKDFNEKNALKSNHILPSSFAVSRNVVAK